MKAYRHDFDAIAAVVVDNAGVSSMVLADITTDALRAAFARYAKATSCSLPL
jgi:hypothetical protein